MDVDELSEGVKGFEGEVRGGGWVVEEGVELDPEEGDFPGEVFEVIGVFENLKLFGSEMLGVEAVLVGVLVAGLAAGLAFRLFVTTDLFITTEVVGGALGGFFGSWEAVEEVADFFV